MYGGRQGIKHEMQNQTVKNNVPWDLDDANWIIF